MIVIISNHFLQKMLHIRSSNFSCSQLEQILSCIVNPTSSVFTYLRSFDKVLHLVLFRRLLTYGVLPRPCDKIQIYYTYVYLQTTTHLQITPPIHPPILGFYKDHSSTPYKVHYFYSCLRWLTNIAFQLYKDSFNGLDSLVFPTSVFPLQYDHS